MPSDRKDSPSSDIGEPGDPKSDSSPRPKRWVFLLFVASVLGAVALGPRGVNIRLKNNTGETLSPVSVCVVGEITFTEAMRPGRSVSVQLTPKGDSTIWIGINWEMSLGSDQGYGPKHVVSLPVYIYSGGIGSFEAEIVGSSASGFRIANVTDPSSFGYEVWGFLPSNRFFRGFLAGIALTLLLVVVSRCLPVPGLSSVAVLRRVQPLPHVPEQGRSTDQLKFDSFAQEFVRAYWETHKSNSFPMPPDEPVEETLEELLAAVSHQTSIDSSSGRTGTLHKIHMAGEFGDWWEFHFHETPTGWLLVGSTASSVEPENPHDLLGPAYAKHFKPFLEHVTNVANERSRA